nr:acyl-CoA 6-desaturase-like [Lytechinus pictus]
MGLGRNQANGEVQGAVHKPRRFVGDVTWDEVKKHDGKTVKEKWLVVDNQVYDITQWSKRHPGGFKVITHYAGQDGSEAFTAFHNDEQYVRKFMKSIHIGQIVKDQIEQKEVVKDFAELRETAEKMGLFNANFLFFFLHMSHIVGLEILSYIVMRTFGVTWLTFIACVMMHGTLQAQVGWFQHDLGHLSCFKSSKWNHALHFIFMSTVKGASAKWWNHMHYQHHAKPNVMNKDPDVRLEKLFVVGEKMPVMVAESGQSSMPYNHQHKYFFLIGPPLLFPAYFQFMIYRHMIKQREWTDLFCNVLYYVRFLYLYLPIMKWWQIFLFYESFRVMESIWFTWVSQSNHIPMEIDEDAARPWLELQLRATCNLEQSFFNDWFTGHLNFQIEHHLFPTMPRHNYHKIAPLVKTLCKKHGIEYKSKTLLQGFADIVRSLKSSGEIWYDAYYHLQDQYPDD